MELREIIMMIDLIEEQYGRDVDRMVRRESLGLAQVCLGGKEACDKIKGQLTRSWELASRKGEIRAIHAGEERSRK